MLNLVPEAHGRTQVLNLQTGNQTTSMHEFPLQNFFARHPCS